MISDTETRKSLENYMSASQMATTASSREKTNGEYGVDYSIVAPRIRNARVFSMGAAFSENALRTWTPAVASVPIAFHRLPFDYCAFMYGDGQPIDANLGQFTIHGQPIAHEATDNRMMVGLLVSYDQKLWPITRCRHIETGAMMIGFAGIRGRQSDTDWLAALSIAAIDQYKNLVRVHEPSPGDRLALRTKRLGGVLMPVPKQYYTLMLRDTEFASLDIARVPRGAPIWRHRWDVRGHERLIYAVRKKPLTHATRERWTKRGWSVYEHQIPDDVEKMLDEHGYMSRPSSSEWVAIKRCWIDPFIKGPAGKPYVPAMRVVGRPSRSSKNARAAPAEAVTRETVRDE